MLRLRQFMAAEDGWGHAEGQAVFESLLAAVEAEPCASVFRVSLAGIRRTDASFPRESVMELARRFRSTKGFCLIDIEDVDLLDNWDAAARKKEQPMFVWSGEGYRLIGPVPSEGLVPLLEFVTVRQGTTTSEASAYLQLNVPNVSNKLKALWLQGYVLRRERTAATGGIEFEYVVPR